MDSRKLISVSIAADRLGLTPQTIRKYINDGRLQAHRSTKTFRIDPEELAKLQRNPPGRRSAR